MRPFSLALSPMFAGLMIIAFIVLLSGCIAPVAPNRADSRFNGKVEQAVIEKLEEDGEVTVIVLLTEPPAMRKLRDSKPGSDEVFELLGELMEEIQGQQAAVVEVVTEEKVEIPYKAIFALVVRINEDDLKRVTALDVVQSIGLDIGGGGQPFDGVPTTEVSPPFAGSATGAGITVAVLDSGYDISSTERPSTIVHEACFVDTSDALDDTGGCPNHTRREFGPGSAADEDNHGTFVTGILTSDGDGITTPAGMAPASKIVALRILDQNAHFQKFSDLIFALDYVIVNDYFHTFHVDLVNISVGTTSVYTDDCDYQTTEIYVAKIAVEILRLMRIATFAGSGNDNLATKMSAPACISSVISVGGVNQNDQLGGDTNRSSTMDIVAPGVDIKSIGRNGQIYQDSGTSYASPYVVACAALWLEMGMAPETIEDKVEDSSIFAHENGHSFPKANCP